MASVEEIFSQIKDDGTLTAKDFVQKLFFDGETNELSDLKNDFKSKFIQPLLKKVKSLKAEDIKKITDPLGISDLNDENFSENIKKIKDKIKEFSGFKVPNFLNFNQNTKEKLKDTNVENVIPENVKQKTNIREQKTLGPDITTVDLSDSAKSFYSQLAKDSSSQYISMGMIQSKELSAYYKKSLDVQEKLLENSSGDGLLKTLGTLLLVGGVAATLVSVFWDDKIKPWLEKTFDVDLSFFDKFEGIVEGIAKFFTMGGLSLKLGPIPYLAGKVFTTFGELLEGGLKAIFSLGLGDDAIKAGSKAAPSMFKGLLPKIAGGLFKGIGAATMKGIPVIGSLFSFYFAWDRFSKGDYVGSVIDFVGGLANLLEFTPLAPLALPISLGAAALNAFLDFKAEGKTPEEKNQSKLNIFKDWGVGIYNTLKNIPFIGSIIKMGKGVFELGQSLFTGDAKKAISSLKDLQQTPLSFLSSALLPIMEISSNVDPKTGKIGLDFSKMKKMMGKQVLNWFPSWMQGAVAYAFGLDEKEPEPEQPQSEDRQQNYKNLVEDRNKINQDINQNEKFLSETKDTNLPNLIEQRKKIEEENEKLKQSLNDINRTEEKYFSDLAKQNNNNQATPVNVENQQSWTPIQGNKPVTPMNDGLLESTEPIQMKLGNSIYETAPNDSVLAFKSGGMLDLALRDISTAIKDINNNIKMLNKNIILYSNNKSETPNVVNLNNNMSKSGSSETKEYLFDTPRDAIMDGRSYWWLLTQQRSSAT